MDIDEVIYNIREEGYTQSLCEEVFKALMVPGPSTSIFEALWDADFDEAVRTYLHSKLRKSNGLVLNFTSNEIECFIPPGGVLTTTITKAHALILGLEILRRLQPEDETEILFKQVATKLLITNQGEKHQEVLYYLGKQSSLWPYFFNSEGLALANMISAYFKGHIIFQCFFHIINKIKTSSNPAFHNKVLVLGSDVVLDYLVNRAGWPSFTKPLLETPDVSERVVNFFLDSMINNTQDVVYF